MNLRNFQSYSVSKRPIVGFIMYAHLCVYIFVMEKLCNLFTISMLSAFEKPDLKWLLLTISKCVFWRNCACCHTCEKKKGKEKHNHSHFNWVFRLPECAWILLAMPMSDRELSMIFVLLEPQLEESKKFQNIYNIFNIYDFSPLHTCEKPQLDWKFTLVTVEKSTSLVINKISATYKEIKWWDLNKHLNKNTQDLLYILNFYKCLWLDFHTKSEVEVIWVWRATESSYFTFYFSAQDNLFSQTF